jgi:hypothetical protein
LTRLIVAFRNCNANAPKNQFVGIVSGSSTKNSEQKIRKEIGWLSPAPLLHDLLQIFRTPNTNIAKNPEDQLSPVTEYEQYGRSRRQPS